MRAKRVTVDLEILDICRSMKPEQLFIVKSRYKSINQKGNEKDNEGVEAKLFDTRTFDFSNLLVDNKPNTLHQTFT